MKAGGAAAEGRGGVLASIEADKAGGVALKAIIKELQSKLQLGVNVPLILIGIRRPWP